MAEVSFKEKCRVFYLVKGDFTRVSRQTIEDCYDGYFKRLWNNTERTEYALVGFEELFKKTLDNPQ